MKISEEEIFSWFNNYQHRHGPIENLADLYVLGQNIQTETPIGTKASFILSKWLTDLYVNKVKKSKGKMNTEKATSTANVANDPVNHPSHYTNSSIECIDAIQASMTAEEFRGFLKGNVFKYLWRYRNKNNPIEDLNKAEWYLHRLIDQFATDILNESDDNGV